MSGPLLLVGFLLSSRTVSEFQAGCVPGNEAMQTLFLAQSILIIIIVSTYAIALGDEEGRREHTCNFRLQHTPVFPRMREEGFQRVKEQGTEFPVD